MLIIRNYNHCNKTPLPTASPLRGGGNPSLAQSVKLRWGRGEIPKKPSTKPISPVARHNGGVSRTRGQQLTPFLFAEIRWPETHMYQRATHRGADPALNAFLNRAAAAHCQACSVAFIKPPTPECSPTQSPPERERPLHDILSYFSLHHFNTSTTPTSLQETSVSFSPSVAIQTHSH